MASRRGRSISPGRRGGSPSRSRPCGSPPRRCLRLALEEERLYAQAASKLLLNAFFTLAGVRYGPKINPAESAPAAAPALADLQATAQRLMSQQPAGRAVINLAGTGEVAGGGQRKSFDRPTGFECAKSCANDGRKYWRSLSIWISRQDRFK